MEPAHPEHSSGDSPDSRPHRRSHTTSSDVVRYAGLFAQRTRVMRSSAMRDLMEITSRPEVISLAGGFPDTSTFPPESFAAQMTRIAQESSARALQYGPTEGFEETRAVICDVMAAEEMSPDPDDIVVTSGGQQALDLICKALLDPGDVVIAEGPTYPGAVPVFCSYEADTRQVEMVGDGMRIDALEELLGELDREGRRPKFIYSVPTFQNPGGVTLALDRRRRLVEIAREREVLLIEDNPYGLLRYEGDPLPTLYSLDGGDYVLYLGTFSKILSPGIRVGWVCAPPPIRSKLVLGKQAADLCTSTLSQFFVREYFGEGRWRDYIDTTDLLAKALRDNVAFVPGEAAFVDGRGSGSMRLNFSAQTEDEIREGIRRIGAVVDEQVNLYETMTGTAHPVVPSAPGPDADSGGDEPDPESPEGEVLPFHRRPGTNS